MGNLIKHILFGSFLAFSSHGHAQGTAAYYKSYMDTVLAANSAGLASQARSAGEEYCTGDSATIERIITAMVAIAKATGETSYLLTSLSWAESLKSAATIVDNQGYLNWPGTWLSSYSSRYIYYQCDDLHAGRGMMRAARAVLTNSNLSGYHTRARAVLDFAARNVIDKWMLARGRPGRWLDGMSSVAPYQFGDKAAYAGDILSDYLAVSPNSTYLGELNILIGVFNKMLVPGDVAGAIKVYDDGTSDNYDTSHANACVSFAVQMYEDGRGVSLATLQGMAKQFTEVIWTGSLTKPMFYNAVDGTNITTWSCHGDYQPYECSTIYIGWMRLASYDAQALQVIKAVIDAIIAGQSSPENPSLRFNNSVPGKIILSAFVAKALLGGTVPQPSPTPSPSPAPAPGAPVISNLIATVVDATTAEIGWDLDQPATGQVEYGLTTTYGKLSVLEPNLFPGHHQNLYNLIPGTTYHFRVKSQNAAGVMAVSGDRTLTMPAVAPDPVPSVDSVAPTLTIISPANGTVVKRKTIASN
jgi:hypothetical protein